MPERLLSSIAHVELLTPDLDASVDYARDILGLDVVDRVGDSAYLRCWGDYYLYSLALTAAPAPGLGHASWRAEGPEQMAEAVIFFLTSASNITGEFLIVDAGTHLGGFRLTDYVLPDSHVLGEIGKGFEVLTS